MKRDNSIRWRISQQAARLNPSLVTGLWLIRAASPGYTMVFEQLAILDMLPSQQEASPQAMTPWHALTHASAGTRLSAVIDALTAIMPKSPLLRELNDLPPLTASEENALGELVDILSTLPLAYLSRFYPLPSNSSPSLSVDGNFDVPLCILRLLLSVLDIQPGYQLYDPCYGSGALLSRAAELLPHARDIGFWAQAMEPGACQLCHVHAYLSGVTIHLGEKSVSPLSEDLHEGREFDCILAHPPFNQSGWQSREADGRHWPFGLPPRSNANFAWLQHVFSHLSPDGHAAVILPNGTLTTQTQSERNIRMGMLSRGIVEAIIALPAGLFASTRVPCCIWLLSGERAAGSSTLFVDAQQLNLREDMSEDVLTLTGLILHHRLGLPIPRCSWYGEASLEEIQKRDYLLSPNFYTLPPQAVLRQDLPLLISRIDSLLPQLSGSPVYDLLEQWKRIAPDVNWERVSLSSLYRITGGIVKKKESFGHGVPMADVATVIRNPFLPDSLPALVEVTPEEMEKYRIRAGDIFMNRSSESVEALACCCVANSDRDAVYGGYLKRLRPLVEDPPDPCYMAAFFRSSLYRREILRVSPVYTTRSNMNRRQLNQIFVCYPGKPMQEKLGKTFLALWQYQETCDDPVLAGKLMELSTLFTEQFISIPISRYLRETGILSAV